MRYYSLNRNSPSVTGRDALLYGLAPDGGLYYPERIPRFADAEIRQFLAAERQASEVGGDGLAFLREVGFRVLQKWFGEQVEEHVLREIAVEAQTFPIPIRQVGDLQVLELFYGPTLSFKDVAARHLARLMSYSLQERGERALLLVATSGDTGGAIAHGFAGLENIKV
ncbi:MAG: threonine synthase, partial [Ardenticatenaceae bacterium]